MFRMRVINWSNRRENQRLLETYFRIRHCIYVETRQWRDIERPIPMEIDAFDDQHAIYLIGVSEDGSLKGGTRLVPTVRPHLLHDVFPDLAGHRPPRAENIFEWTRFFVVPELRPESGPSPAAGIVLCGMLEYALRHGIMAITVVCESFWIDRLRGIGWTVEQLGPTLHHRDGDILALFITVTAQTLEATKRAYDFPPEQNYLNDETPLDLQQPVARSLTEPTKRSAG